MTPGVAPPADARTKPNDRSRYVAHKDATAPSERRVQTEGPNTPRTAQPPVPPKGRSDLPRTGQDGRRNDDRHGTAPVQPGPLRPRDRTRPMNRNARRAR